MRHGGMMHGGMRHAGMAAPGMQHRAWGRPGSAAVARSLACSMGGAWGCGPTRCAATWLRRAMRAASSSCRRPTICSRAAIPAKRVVVVVVVVRVGGGEAQGCM